MFFLYLQEKKKLMGNLQVSANKEIRQANSLTEARFEMSALELDLLFYILSQLKKEKLFYEINVVEMQSITGKKHNYQELREATFKLRERTYEIKYEKKLLQIGIFSSCEYNFGLGTIEVEISPKIVPFLFELKEQFTSFRLMASLNMSSKYAKRIYTMLSQWKDSGVWRVSIKELKTRLKLIDPKGKEPEQYKQLAQFKDRVLDPAVSQINEHSELKVSYKLIKKGRSFVDIEFTIDIQASKYLGSIDGSIDFSFTPQELRCINNLKELGIVRQDLLNKIAKNEDLRQQTFKWLYDLKTGKFGKVENPAGLLLKTLGLVN
jgi:plasmid replication initiation protein